VENGVGAYRETGSPPSVPAFCPPSVPAFRPFATGDGGYSPSGNLVFDSSGNLYGATFAGGASQSGGVFELTPGSPWTETVLHASAGGTDGDSPAWGVAFDAAGNLFGTTTGSGDPTCGCGTVFELMPSLGGWNETTLYAFTGQADGKYPSSATLLDSAGNLYGTTSFGGTVNSLCQSGCGVVYEFPGVGAAVK
jgi:uncharacterized repeat protein (TIGR03803 family)